MWNSHCRKKFLNNIIQLYNSTIISLIIQFFENGCESQILYRNVINRAILVHGVSAVALPLVIRENYQMNQNKMFIEKGVHWEVCFVHVESLSGYLNSFMTGRVCNGIIFWRLWKNCVNERPKNWVWIQTLLFVHCLILERHILLSLNFLISKKRILTPPRIAEYHEGRVWFCSILWKYLFLQKFTGILLLILYIL